MSTSDRVPDHYHLRRYDAWYRHITHAKRSHYQRQRLKHHNVRVPY
ncbi:MAG TPA: hypothetical protein VFO16_21120 [Pseudonocardiaceae bacterium]|nr:hypothetical protein [Pseudonocardiaceae bacterium]